MGKIRVKTSVFVLITYLSTVGGGRAQFSETSDITRLEKLKSSYTSDINVLTKKKNQQKKAQVALSVVSAISGASALAMGLTAALNKNLTAGQKKGLITGALAAGTVSVGTGIGAGGCNT